LYSGPYHWFNFRDISLILDFFFKGKFIVPFCIFGIVYCLTGLLAGIIFNYFAGLKLLKWSKKIKNINIAKLISDQNETEYDRNNSNTDWIIKLYKIIKKSISANQLTAIHRDILRKQKTLESNCYLVTRALLACTLYLPLLPNFGMGLYIVLMIFLLLSLYLLIQAYVILQITPNFVRQIDYEITKIV